MAPKDIEQQTKLIVKFLLEDDDDVTERRLDESSDIEVDSADLEDTFDPVLIADQLRNISDTINEDERFNVALKELKKAAAQEAVDLAFSRGVDALCEAHVSKSPEVAPEMQLIKASVAFGLYVKKSAPELKSAVRTALASFLNRRVGSWVTQKGGWDKVPDISN